MNEPSLFIAQATIEENHQQIIEHNAISKDVIGKFSKEGNNIHIKLGWLSPKKI